MEVMGLCHICGKSGMLQTCMLCGAQVCPSCYDPVHHICKNCKR